MKKRYIVVPMLLSMVSTGFVNADEVVNSTDTVVSDLAETTVAELPQVEPSTTITELPQVEPSTTVTEIPQVEPSTTVSSNLDVVTDEVKPEVPQVEPSTTVSTTVEEITTQSVIEDVVVSSDYVVVNTTVGKVDKVSYETKEVAENTEETTTTKEGELKVLPNTGAEHSSFAWLSLLPFLSGAYLIKKNQKKEVE